MNDYWRHKEEIDRRFNAPENRRLKYAAFAVIGAVIAAQIALIFFLDDISERTRLFVQGCIGLGAIVFVVLMVVLTYRVYSDYFHSRR